MPWPEDALIARAERATGESAEWLRRLTRSSRAAFWKFALSMPLREHRRHAPRPLVHLARLGATQVEDCGPCVVTVLRYALADGVPVDLLQAAIAAPDALPGLERRVHALGRQVAGGAPMAAGEYQELRDAVGEAMLAELVLAAATSRIYPAMKRGLGLAQSCALTPIDVQSLAAGMGR